MLQVTQNPYVLPAPTLSGAVSTYELWVDRLARSSPAVKHLAPRYRFIMPTPTHTEVTVSLLHLHPLLIRDLPRKSNPFQNGIGWKSEKKKFPFLCAVFYLIWEFPNFKVLYSKNKKKLSRSESSSDSSCFVYSSSLFLPRLLLSRSAIVKTQQHVPSGLLV